MLQRFESYEAVRSRFDWAIPEFFNIGVDICDKWAADPMHIALIHEKRDGSAARYTFADIRRLSNQTANLFVSRGLRAGDRVGILLPQGPETAIAHVAAYKVGAIVVPLFTLFGLDALRYRLKDAGIKVLITDTRSIGKIEDIRADIPDLETVFCIDGARRGGEDFHAALNSMGETFQPVQTRADDPALIIYTSGTTGPPKGALHAHRTLLGHLPGVEMSHNFLGEAGDLMWTPADWAWIGGLIDVLLPAWHHGIPVLAHRFEKFEPETAFALIAKHNVRNVFLPPTALKMMRGVADANSRWELDIRSLASGGESLGPELLQWGRDTFGLTINEFYGQTECNMVLSSCETLFPSKPGAIGKAAPGHDVEIVDDAGRILPAGEIGAIAVRRPDPVMFLGYWNNRQATQEKFIGDWLITGDTGMKDADGYVTFVGRNDDVITSAGYRIGPGPIEDCLLGHPAVRMAAVVGAPDAERTEIVKAFVVLEAGFAPGDALTRELQDHVRTRLAAHEYPRQVRYVDSLPMTTTGKIIRHELRNRGD
ncbi:MAG: acyl-CoA synthetase [Betaproteobacteria bacterium]|nr:acyl-CoA synthetase [Betaproteobacteria bacterium]